jgi:hypothetical protein
MASVNISIDSLRLLFEQNCKHQDEYKKGKPVHNIQRGVWHDCEDCILRSVKDSENWRDLCWHIWHEGILEK